MSPELQRHEAILAAIIENSEDAIISKDLSSRILSWNNAAERMFGYSKAEMIGKLIHTLIPADRQNEEDEIIAKLKRGEKVDHFETMRVTKDGRLLHVSLSISPVRDSNGNIVGASKIARDITRHKVLEERLAVTNEIARFISGKLEISTVLQSVVDATMRLAEAQYGVFFYRKTDRDSKTQWKQAWAGGDAKASGSFRHLQASRLFKDIFEGKPFFLSDNITTDVAYRDDWITETTGEQASPVRSLMALPIVTLSGQTIGALFLGHPAAAAFNGEHKMLVSAIAAQAAVTLDNAELYEKVNALSSRKDEFIGFASHELKTPLTSLKGYIQIAHETNIPIGELYPRLIKQVNRLETLVNDLLDLSRVQAGKMEYRFSPVDVKDIIRDAIEVSDIHQRYIVTEFPDSEVVVSADSAKISQVLVNLLSNAAKYSSPDTTIQVRCMPEPGEVIVTVTDEGIGIPENELPQIFNLFYRVGNTKAKGTGLGLYIAREIMEAHGGAIWAESEVGRGSSFFIRLPLAHTGAKV